MRLLVDQNLPVRVARALRHAGHDVVHTEDIDLQTAGDPTILARCCDEQCMLVTADKKLTKYLVLSGARCPSVLVTRDVRGLAVDELIALLVANLPQIDEFLSANGNSILSLTAGRPIRAELLPIPVFGVVNPGPDG